ncbi:MAG: peptidoglycan-binding protein [Pseudomonadota bacterium]
MQSEREGASRLGWIQPVGRAKAKNGGFLRVAGAPIPIGPTLLKAVAPRYRPNSLRHREQQRIIAAGGAALPRALARHDIQDRLEIAHLIAQCAHESDGFTTTVEYASGRAYEGRLDLGNTEPGDGPRFRGRGLIQLTGRANYRRFGSLAGINLEAEPEHAADPAVSVILACLYWRDRSIGALARRDDLRGVTRRINGGLNGLADRRRYLQKAKMALGLPPEASAADTRHLQAALGQIGLPVAIDGILGPETRAALITLQAEMDLPITGRPDDATLAVLASSVEDGSIVEGRR